MNGSLYTWSNLNQYFASYLKYHGNPNLVPEDTSFLMPCIFLVQYCFMTIGVNLGNKVGPRFSTLIGIIIMYISYAIMIFFTNYYLILVAMGVFGLGDGLANLSVIKNCWKYFPSNAALVNGIIIGGLGISSAVLTPIADYFIINPDRKEPDKDGIYSEKIANNLLNFLYFLLILFLVLGFFAVAFTFKYEPENNSSNEDSEKEGKLETLEEKSTENEGSNLSILCYGFWSITNLILGLFCFCGPCKNFIFI
jgi:MFS family permease